MFFTVLLLGMAIPSLSQRTLTVKLYMDHLPNYTHAVGDGFLQLDDTGGVSGKILWVISSRVRSIDKINATEPVQGTFDQNRENLSISTIGTNTARIVNRYDLNFKENEEIVGKDEQKFPGGGQSIVITGNYFFSLSPRRVVVEFMQGSPMQGRWKVISGGKTGIFSNQYLEIFPDGTGISRNDSLNTFKNVLFFDWRQRSDSLWLKDKGYAFHIEGSTLRVAGHILKRMSSDPFERYQDKTSSAYEASWVTKGIRRGKALTYGVDTLADHNNMFYDFHPFTHVFGEMVVNSHDSSLQVPYKPFQNIIFMDYLLGENGEDSVVGLNNDYRRPVSFKFSDGIIILSKHDTVYYMAKIGTPFWLNLSALHTLYNSYNYSPILAPPSCEWIVCPVCNGLGDLSNYYTEKEVLDGPVWKRIRTHHITICGECNGKGGWYKNSLTGERVNYGDEWQNYLFLRHN